jgi:pimeloyl-ACP methyl ester carboxylesterase
MNQEFFVNSADNNDKMSILSQSEIEELERKVQFFNTGEGTRLAFHEYGDPDGRPVFFYHGTGSHVHGMLLHKPGQLHGFRIIAPDRPGVAQSDFRNGWTILEYAHDMAKLADHLKIDKFGAIGISGGGPTLLASAFAIPERLQCVVDLACATPVYSNPEMLKHLGTMDRFYAKLGTTLPLSLFRIPFALLGLMQTIFKSPKSFAKMFSSSLCASDKDIFSIQEFQYLFMRDFQELFRHGSKGPAYDALTVYRPWGFDLTEVNIPIEVFHGTEDKFVPLKFSEYLASQVKNVNINKIEGKGHFGHIAYGYRLLEEIKKRFYH